MSRHLLSWLLGIAVCVSASNALADNPPELDAPGRLYREAVKLFEQDKFPEAEAKLLEVWALRKSHDVAVSLAQTEDRLGQHAAAAEHLEYALATMLAAKSAAYQQKIRDMLSDAKKGCARLEIATAPSAELTVDGTSHGTADAAGAIVAYLDPGIHTVVAREGDREARTTVDAVRGADTKLSIALPPAPPPVNPAPHSAPAPEERSVIPTAVLGSLAGVALASGVGFAVASSGKGSRANDLGASIAARRGFCSPASPGFAADCEDLDSLDASAGTFRGVAIGSFVGAGALLAATIAYAAWPSVDSSASERPAPGVAAFPILTPETQGLGINGAF